MPPAEPYFNIGPAFWKRPKNWKQLVDAVSWASRGDVPLRVDGPDFIGVNLVEQPEQAAQDRSPGELQPAGSIDQEHSGEVCVPEGESATAVWLYSIESEAGSALNFRMQGSTGGIYSPEAQHLWHSGGELVDSSSQIAFRSKVRSILNAEEVQ